MIAGSIVAESISVVKETIDRLDMGIEYQVAITGARRVLEGILCDPRVSSLVERDFPGTPNQNVIVTRIVDLDRNPPSVRHSNHARQNASAILLNADRMCQYYFQANRADPVDLMAVWPFRTES